MPFRISDTPVEIERLQSTLLARRSPDARQRLAFEISAELITRSRDSLRRSMPHGSSNEDAVLSRWLLLQHGPEVARLFDEGRRRHRTEARDA